MQYDSLAQYDKMDFYPTHFLYGSYMVILEAYDVQIELYI